MLLSGFVLNANRLINNLNDFEVKEDLATLRLNLRLSAINTNRKILKSIFKEVKTILESTLDLIDSISKVDTDTLGKSEIETSVKLIHKNLILARMEFDRLGEYRSKIHKIPKLSQAYTAFKDLIKIYTDYIESSHLTFSRLDYIDVSLLPFFKHDSNALKQVNRNLVIRALTDLLKPQSRIDYRVSNFARDAFEKLLSHLSQELVNEVSSIYDEVNAVISEGVNQTPKLTSLTVSINKILSCNSHPNLRDIHVLEALQNDKVFSSLIKILFSSAYKIKEIKLSDLAKVILTLHSVRTKLKNPEWAPLR